MAAVKIVFYKQNENKKDESPLFLRITKNRKPKYISLGLRILEKYWDAENQRVRKSYPNSGRVNRYLAKKVSLAEAAWLDLETNTDNVQSKKIKEDILGLNTESFLKHSKKFLAEMENKYKLGTYDKAASVISKLETYLGTKDLLFTDMDVAWLKKYEIYLRDDLSNSTNTIHTNMKVIRRIINDAVSEGVIKYDMNPFLKYKLKWEQTKKEFLTEEELDAMVRVDLVQGSMKDIHRDMYVFACYTGGLRISDMLQLRWKNFNGTHLLVTTQKTDTTVSIKVPDIALKILDKYKDKKDGPDSFIFPLFSNEKDYKDRKVLSDAISSHTAYANTDLKDIAESVDITKNIHFHTSRHTWATRALRKGMRIEYVSKLLGHTDIKTTQIYAKIVNEELDKAMDIFNAPPPEKPQKPRKTAKKTQKAA